MAPALRTNHDIKQMHKELQAFGIDENTIAKELKQFNQPRACELLSENLDTFMWFTQVDDLLKYQNGVCLGLDVLAVKADCEMSQREVTPTQYKHLRAMASAVAHKLNERLERV
ncbi:hypothetical protein tloyanaT_26290 [Thalassotalea loyana]|uniref:Uncharacterized protein n=1 Tax=Thalassotalea loyana TaxID=280483 RepID=A0ABQ6HIE4_9GAMM|nr:hypothetical protein [Thalassotalea loyana]GLX86376.1 hypothetical protein tloyanaT_26290 [Thalassotalea loyana]